VAIVMGARIVHGSEEGKFAPGYNSVLFEHPDGIRIEANFMPGKGRFGCDRELPLKATRV
jgi:hypothetical protein